MLEQSDSHRVLPKGADAVRLAPGQHVERYEVEGLIGLGGLAEVYRVQHLELGHRAALKVLRRESSGIFQRTLREGRLQAGLRHPNVVGMYDVLRVGEAPALVMEYVAGPSLEQLLRQFQPSLTQTDALARGILSGVIAAHAAGLVHRDLKPANVLIAVEQGRPVPKVADFGLARAAVISEDQPQNPRLTRQGAMLGTPAYMAPEQYSDASSVDERADVFGLGALLYELVTGVMAFPGRDAMECYRSIVQSSWRPVRELVPSAPGRMVRAIEAALLPDAGARVATAEQLLAIWTGEAEGRLSALPEEPIWEPEHIEMVRALTPVLRTGESGEDGGGGGRVTPTMPEARGDAPPPPAPRTAGLTLLPSNPQADPTPAPDADDGPVSPPDEPSLDELRGRPSGRKLLVGVAALLALGLALLLVTSGDADPAPEAPPSAPVEALEAAPAPVEEAPTTAAATPATSAPTRAATASRPAATPTAAPAAAPEPAPERKAAATGGENVIVSGVARAYLVADDGTRRQPGVVPPGHYTLYAFFDATNPTPALELDVVAGRVSRIRCEPGLRSCR